MDALALGHVTQYRAYDPPVLGLRVQIVSTGSGGVLCGAEGCFDAREAGVQASMQRFHGQHLDTDDRSYGWKLLLASPRHYAQFVMHELLATLEPRLAPALASTPM